jgi:hypothetical protein
MAHWLTSKCKGDKCKLNKKIDGMPHMCSGCTQEARKELQKEDGEWPQAVSEATKKVAANVQKKAISANQPYDAFPSERRHMMAVFMQNITPKSSPGTTPQQSPRPPPPQPPPKTPPARPPSRPPCVGTPQSSPDQPPARSRDPTELLHAIEERLAQMEHQIVQMSFHQQTPQVDLVLDRLVQDRLGRMENVQTMMGQHMEKIEMANDTMTTTMLAFVHDTKIAMTAVVERHHAMMEDRLKALENDVMLKGKGYDEHGEHISLPAGFREGYEHAQREGYERIGNLMDAIKTEIQPMRKGITEIYEVCLATRMKCVDIHVMCRDSIKPVLSDIISRMGSSLGHSNDSNDTNAGSGNWVNAISENVETYNIASADFENASLDNENLVNLVNASLENENENGGEHEHENENLEHPWRTISEV